MARRIILIILSFISNNLFCQQLISPKGLPQGARFGFFLSASNEYFIIGAPHDDYNNVNSGAAYLYKVTENDVVLEKKLGPNNPANGDQFGFAVKMSGKYMIIGCRGDDSNGINTGSAYVYELKNKSWVLDTVLIMPEPKPFAQYGISWVNNESIIIGAQHSREKNNAVGSLFVYEKNEKKWKQTAKLTPSDNPPISGFGNGVIQGNYIIAGAHKDHMDRGSVYLFKRNKHGKWEEVKKILAPDANTGDLFGHHIDIYENMVIIAADKDAIEDKDYGSAYIYELKDNSLKFVNKLIPPDGNPRDRFGSAVNIYDEKMIITAYKNNSSGSAYFYELSDGAWKFMKKITPPISQNEMLFGESLAITDSYYLIGASTFDGTKKDQGCVFFYRIKK